MPPAAGASSATSADATCPRRSWPRWRPSSAPTWRSARDPRFWAEFRELLATYSGRPTPIYRADRFAAEALATARRRSGSAPKTPTAFRRPCGSTSSAKTSPTPGAHKINNALGQALLTRRLGKSRVIAETGAGQHGVATATACALLDLPCVVFMGEEDIRRQAPNVLRMHALGAEVRPVTSGSATLKDAVNEAMRDWVTNVETTHYVLGSAMGPHPYPTIVRDLQRVLGDEAAAQLAAVEGRLPDLVLACVGGGSNAIGLLDRFIGEPAVRMAVAEAAGDGIATGRHAAALAGGTPGILHGSRSLMLQDADGQVVEAHSISAGLDYPGVGPQIAALVTAGRLELAAATDAEALAAVRAVARVEGILPALETAHAFAALPRLLAGTEGSGAPYPAETVVLLGLIGARRQGPGRARGSEVPAGPRRGRRRTAAADAAARDERHRGRPADRRRLRQGACGRTRRADPVPRGGLSRTRRRRLASRSRPSTPAPTCSRSGCPTPTRLPTARRSSGPRARAAATAHFRPVDRPHRADRRRPARHPAGARWPTPTRCSAVATAGRSRAGWPMPGPAGIIVADLTPDEGEPFEAVARAAGLPSCTSSRRPPPPTAAAGSPRGRADSSTASRSSA